MSFSTDENYQCPCGKDFRIMIWSSMNVTEKPDLKEALIDGRLNVVFCTQCRSLKYLDRFFIYHDPKLELMAFIYPEPYKKDKDTWIQKTKNDFEQAQKGGGEILSYNPITFFGVDDLIQLIKREEEQIAQGEILTALAKSHSLNLLSLSPSLARQHSLPTILPMASQKNSISQNIILALQKLVKKNENLTVYKGSLKRLEDKNLSRELDKIYNGKRN